MADEKANQEPEQDPDLEVSSEQQAAAASEAAARMPKIIKFEQLARCGDEIWIECNNQIYRLRRTRANKLILTK